MSTFTRKRLNQPPIYRAIKKNPFIFFGLPLMISVISGSFALSHLTQTRYDLHKNKTKKAEEEERLRMSKDRRQTNLQKEYLRLQGTQEGFFDNWEIKRVERPPGAFDGILK